MPSATIWTQSSKSFDGCGVVASLPRRQLSASDKDFLLQQPPPYRQESSASNDTYFTSCCGGVGDSGSFDGVADPSNVGPTPERYWKQFPVGTGNSLSATSAFAWCSSTSSGVGGITVDCDALQPSSSSFRQESNASNDSYVTCYTHVPTSGSTCPTPTPPNTNYFGGGNGNNNNGGGGSSASGGDGSGPTASVDSASSASSGGNNIIGRVSDRGTGSDRPSDCVSVNAPADVHCRTLAADEATSSSPLLRTTSSELTAAAGRTAYRLHELTAAAADRLRDAVAQSSEQLSKYRLHPKLSAAAGAEVDQGLVQQNLRGGLTTTWQRSTANSRSYDEASSRRRAAGLGGVSSPWLHGQLHVTHISFEDILLPLPATGNGNTLPCTAGANFNGNTEAPTDVVMTTGSSPLSTTATGSTTAPVAISATGQAFKNAFKSHKGNATDTTARGGGIVGASDQAKRPRAATPPDESELPTAHLQQHQQPAGIRISPRFDRKLDANDSRDLALIFGSQLPSSPAQHPAAAAQPSSSSTGSGAAGSASTGGGIAPGKVRRAFFVTGRPTPAKRILSSEQTLSGNEQTGSSLNCGIVLSFPK